MNIKSLLLGSAAALAVVSGAQAADAIVAAEPEPAEYVKVCDAFGTGYFYIPGTETCLQISGWARFQTDVIKDSSDDYTFNAWGKGYVSLSSKSDSELGTIEGFIGIEGDYTGRARNEGDTSDFYVDEVFLTVGGFKAGYFYHFLDAGINGETDSLGDNTEFVSVQYTYDADGFSVGVSVDELGDSTGSADNAVGVAAKLGASLGGVAANVVGYYDTDAEEGGVRAILSADVGPGAFQVGGLYNTGVNRYYDNGIEWAVATSYAAKVSDAITVTPGFQYTENKDNTDDWKAGVAIDYALAAGLSTKVSVQYSDSSEDVTGYFRLQRSF